MAELTDRQRAAIARHRPRNRAQLHGWLRAVLGVHVPDRPACAGHVSPLDYLDHVFFERPGDALVWANRGGGKTFYGAVATLLDLLFKPGVRVRVLGGSLDQSAMMHEHLRSFLETPALRGRVAGKLTQRGVRLDNGSELELLAQAETSVRGQRVQKLRCDEVELFDADVWSAAQFVTRSAVCGGRPVRGAIEGLSTMHRPHGLMRRLVQQAQQAGGWRLFNWCILDVMDRCRRPIECHDCCLHEWCGGRAKEASWGPGFVAADDAAAQRRRSSRAAFTAEMLCERPSRSDAVYPAFDPDLHVAPVEPDATLQWIGGMDFGLRSPFVMLWAQRRPLEDGAERIEVIDEHVQRDRPMRRHLREIAARGWPAVRWVGVDPAGRQRSDQTGRSTIALLREAGWRVRARRMGLLGGIELVRRRIERGTEEGGGEGAEPLGLLVHPRCRTLIESLRCYHFDADRPQREEPVKDGYDHAADALRYMLINAERAEAPITVRSY